MLMNWQSSWLTNLAIKWNPLNISLTAEMLYGWTLNHPRGREVGKYRPALVLSSQEYNQKTGLLICCPISTSIRGIATEVPISNLERPSVVAAGLIQSLSWKERRVKKIRFIRH